MSILWSLFDKNTSSYIEGKEFQPTPGTADGELPDGLDANLAWLQHETDPDPVYDPNTNRLDPGESVELDQTDPRTGTRRFVRNVVPLSAEQIDDREVQAKLRAKGSNVRAIAAKIRNDENLTVNEMRSVIDYIVLRDRLDL